MVTKVLNKKPVQLTLTVLIILGALGCIFTPNYILFKIGSSFAVHIMLAYLFLGLIFLALGQSRLTFTSLFCCAGLCLFLKFFSNWDWPQPNSNDPSLATFRLAHFNITNADQPYDATMASLLDVNADILSFQEVTPDWHAYFQKSLQQKYPYSTSIVRFDPYGLAIYSKHPIISVDTFLYNEIPNLAVVYEHKEEKELFRVLSSYLTPPIYTQALESLSEHIAVIANQINKTELPTFAVGDYNAPPWWEEIRFLMNEGRLTDSRSCATQGLDNLWKYPIDYIFHSDHFHCIDFDNLEYTLYGHLGIRAVFQFNKATPLTSRRNLQELTLKE